MTKTGLEQDILQAIQFSVQKAIGEALSGGYNSPLTKLCTEVVTKHESSLKQVIEAQLITLIDSSSFQKELGETMRKTLARTIISRAKGSVEKSVNELSSNPTMKAKLILAVEACLENYNG